MLSENPTHEPTRAAIESIRRELDAARASRIYLDYGNALKLISQVVFTRSSGFVLEFLQNAEDAGQGLEAPGCFTVSINETRLRVTHNGRPFSDPDVAALCGIRSAKRPEKGTLGYLGIGFKSVFKVSDRPEIYSGGFRFGFVKPYSAADSLWQVMPVWIEIPSEQLDESVTTFIVPFRDKKSYALLRNELAHLGPQMYLFLRWIKTITIIDEPVGTKTVLANLGTDASGITRLRVNDDPHQFRIFRATVTVPAHVMEDPLTQDYRAGVTHREVAIGFALDRVGNLAPSEATAWYGGVYSFLPLGESKSGAAFPIQADFLVQPGRDAINYEALWNQWLVGEVARLCKEAIVAFIAHPEWRYQFLPAFAFSHSKGNESYDKLFGPQLINPIERYLDEEPCVPTASGSLAPLSKVVRLTEETAAAEGLVNCGILGQDEIATVLSEKDDSILVHPKVADPSPQNPIRQVNRWDLLANTEFLRKRAAASNAPDWFRSLYKWLLGYRVYKTGRSRQERGYHEIELVLTADGRLVTGGKVRLADELRQVDQLVIEIAGRWQQGRPLLHPEVLRGAATEAEREDVRGFLMGYTGVQHVELATLCRSELLPFIVTSAPKPDVATLLKYTHCCYQILGRSPGSMPELWVLSKGGEVRAAKEVFFGSEYLPQPDWEKNHRYLPGLNFVSAEYIDGVSEDEIQMWRSFFIAGGVKRDPDDGVEKFAVTFAEEFLRKRYSVVTRIEEHDFGFDLEAQDASGVSIQIEVKGRREVEDIELTPNESEAARKHQDSYHLHVVSSIPESPVLYVVRNPARVPQRNKIMIPAAVWLEQRAT